MKEFIKGLFGFGSCLGIALMGIGFFLWLFGCAWRIAIFAGTALCAGGYGYIGIEEGVNENGKEEER